MAATPDLSALTTDFVKFGGKVFMKNVNALNLEGQGILVMKNLSQPEVLPKLSAVGNPRPYRADDDTSGNGVAFTDRTLTVRQSKWDFLYDPKKYFNTYLSKGAADPYYQYSLDVIFAAYMAALNDSALGTGVYNGSGSTAAAICNGFLTIIAAEISGGDITPVVTGAVTSANAVEKVDLLIASFPEWMVQKGGKVLCSRTVFNYYVQRYRSLYNYQFKANADGEYMIDNYPAWSLKVASWMGSSNRLIATIADNLTVGFGADSQVAATPSFNLIEVRTMIDIGCEIADLGALKVNDQA